MMHSMWYTAQKVNKWPLHYNSILINMVIYKLDDKLKKALQSLISIVPAWDYVKSGTDCKVSSSTLEY